MLMITPRSTATSQKNTIGLLSVINIIDWLERPPSVRHSALCEYYADIRYWKCGEGLIIRSLPPLSFSLDFVEGRRNINDRIRRRRSKVRLVGLCAAAAVLLSFFLFLLINIIVIWSFHELSTILYIRFTTALEHHPTMEREVEWIIRVVFVRCFIWGKWRGE